MHAWCMFLPLCSLYTRGNNVCAGHGIGRWWLCIIVMQITLKRMKTKFYNIAYRVSFCVQSGRTWCCYSNFPYLNICDSRRHIKIYEFESKQMQSLSSVKFLRLSARYLKAWGYRNFVLVIKCKRLIVKNGIIVKRHSIGQSCLPLDCQQVQKG
jgi:hypothetical protein